MEKQIAVPILLSSVKDAHKNLLLTMEGVTNDVASYKPAGKANPIAGVYAHLILSEDFFIHSFLKKEKPLFEDAWKDKTGISSLQPTEWEKEFPKWLREVSIEVESLKPYTHAVFTATEEYIASLKDADLEKNVDMSMFGMGQRPTGDFLSGIIIGHIMSIMGEISVLKGIQGLKGYPF